VSATVRETSGVTTRRIAHEIGPPLAGIGGLIAVWAAIAAVTTTEGVPSPRESWDAFVAGVADGAIPVATG
jgi:hypothetical protein